MIKRGSELLSWEWDDIEDFNVKYWNDLSTRVECQSFLVRFDGLGLLAMRNQVDLDLIYKFAARAHNAAGTMDDFKGDVERSLRME
jgi:hypothetical protein